MKFAAVAALALVAISSVDAQDTTAPPPARCNAATAGVWISTSANTVGKACLDDAGFRGSGYAPPTEDSIKLVCSSIPCRALVNTVLAAYPATGDCTVARSGVQTKFYETVINPYAEACKTVTPPPVTAPVPTTTAPTPTTTAPAPTTTAPAPTTTAPAPTTTAPAPTTTAPAPTTTAPAPTTTAPTPTIKPDPTTPRPQC